MKSSMKVGGNASASIGVGATGFGQAAYGNYPQAVDSPTWGTDNTVKVNALPNCLRGGKRGSRRMKQSRRHAKLGGTTLLDMSVPIALLAANQLYTPKRSRRDNKFNKTRRMSGKRRGGGRLVDGPGN